MAASSNIADESNFSKRKLFENIKFLETWNVSHVTLVLKFTK